MRLEQVVRFALLANEKIVETVAKTNENLPLIEINRNPEGKYPLIELHTISGRDNQFASDTVWNEHSVIELNFYCEYNEYSEVENEIKELMRDLGFYRSNYFTTRNNYTNITQYSANYRTTITPERIDKLYAEYYEERNESPTTPILPDGWYYDPETGEEYEIKDGIRI